MLSPKIIQNKNAFDSRIKTQARVFIAKEKKESQPDRRNSKDRTYEMILRLRLLQRNVRCIKNADLVHCIYYGDTTKYDYEH